MSFTAQRAAALTLLTNHAAILNRTAGNFLGQLAVHPVPMSDAQRNWLVGLLEQAGLPAYSETEWGGQAP